MLPLHAEAGGFGLAPGTAVAVFAVAAAVLALLAYDAYRRRGEWME